MHYPEENRETLIKELRKRDEEIHHLKIVDHWKSARLVDYEISLEFTLSNLYQDAKVINESEKIPEGFVFYERIGDKIFCIKLVYSWELIFGIVFGMAVLLCGLLYVKGIIQ